MRHRKSHGYNRDSLPLYLHSSLPPSKTTLFVLGILRMNAHFKFLYREPNAECRAARTEDEVYFMANRQWQGVGAELWKIESFGWQLHQRSTRVCNQIISTKNREIITSAFLQIHFHSFHRQQRNRWASFSHCMQSGCIEGCVDFPAFWRCAPFVYFFEMRRNSEQMACHTFYAVSAALRLYRTTDRPHAIWLCKLVDSIRLCLHALALALAAFQEWETWPNRTRVPRPVSMGG